MEYAVTSNLSFKAEYLYMRFRNRTTDFPNALNSVNGTGTAANFANGRRNVTDQNLNLVRVGVNYRFNLFGAVAPVAPVVARD